jgi:sirohydrochlorin ferrochelatase
MVPHFLSPGVHVVEDLENARTKLSEEYPEVQFRLAAPLGRHPKLLEILSERIDEALTLPLEPNPTPNNPGSA